MCEDEAKGGVDAGEGVDEMDTFGSQVAQADDGERRAVDDGGEGLVAQDVDAGLLEDVGNEGGVKPDIMVAERGVHAKGGAGLSQYATGIAGEVGNGFTVADEEAAGRAEVVAEGDVVAGKRDEVWFLGVGEFDTVGQVFGADGPTAMEVGQVRDGESVEGARQGWKGEMDVVDFDAMRFDENGVNGTGCHAGRGVADPFEECAAADV